LRLSFHILSAPLPSRPLDRSLRASEPVEKAFTV